MITKNLLNDYLNRDKPVDTPYKRTVLDYIMKDNGVKCTYCINHNIETKTLEYLSLLEIIAFVYSKV